MLILECSPNLLGYVVSLDLKAIVDSLVLDQIRESFKDVVVRRFRDEKESVSLFHCDNNENIRGTFLTFLFCLQGCILPSFAIGSPWNTRYSSFHIYTLNKSFGILLLFVEVDSSSPFPSTSRETLIHFNPCFRASFPDDDPRLDEFLFPDHIALGTRFLFKI